MKVTIPSPLHSYTGGRSRVEGRGATLGELLSHLEGRFPGLRFRVIDEQDRIRPHILFYVKGILACDLRHPIGPDDEVVVVAALSGG